MKDYYFINAATILVAMFAESLSWQQNPICNNKNINNNNNNRPCQDSTFFSRRNLIKSVSPAVLSVILVDHAFPNSAVAADRLDPRAIVSVRLNSPSERLGLKLANTVLRGKSVVVIQQNIAAKNEKLEPGMILLNFQSAQEVVDRIQSGPFPLELQFYNLAAGGDAFNDLGATMVTAQDAFDLAKRTDNDNNPGENRLSPSSQEEYSIITTNAGNGAACAIKSRRGDVLEIEYEATAVISGVINSAGDASSRRIIYDSSEFRGTGQPYQMVLGSGDMLPGVDQGLYDMCPGQERLIKIPPRLAYGVRGNKLFRIPPNTPLEWKIKLISIDATIREDNNNQTREEREARALY